MMTMTAKDGLGADRGNGCFAQEDMTLMAWGSVGHNQVDHV
jgi:hypothetical protein